MAGLGDGEADGDGLGLADGDGLGLADGDGLGLADGDGLGDEPGVVARVPVPLKAIGSACMLP